MVRETPAPPGAGTRAPVPASIFAVVRRTPFIVFDERGQVLVDFEPSPSDAATVYVSPQDLPHLRTYLRQHLSAITSAEQIPPDDVAWAIHRSMLYEASVAFREVNGRIPTAELIAILHRALDFQLRHRGDFPYLDVFFRAPYTSVTHAIETSLTATALAVAEGRLGEEGLRSVAIGGLFADVAKLNLSSEMLMRDGPLDEGEWRLMRQHSLRSAEIMHRAGIVNRAALRGAISHHERSDGSGYPDMLRGEDIPPEARHIAIADVFSAMTVDRAFQARVDPFDALTEMARDGGGGLDPALLRTFIQLLAKRHTDETVRAA